MGGITKLAAVAAVLVAMSPSQALAEYCDVDLIASTDAHAGHYELIAGEVEVDGALTGDIALCLSWSSSASDEVGGPVGASGLPGVVAYVEAGAEGVCATLDDMRTCSGEGCDAIEVWATGHNVVFNSRPNNAACSDVYGLAVAARAGEVRLREFPARASVSLYNTTDVSAMASALGTTACDLTGDAGTQYRYGRLYYYNGGAWYYANAFAVCDSSSVLCYFSESLIDDATDAIKISLNSNDNFLSRGLSYEYCSAQYGLDTWDPNWGGYVILEGGAGNDTLSG